MVLVDHVLAHAAANTTCGAVAILGIVQLSVYVYSGMIGNEVQFFVVHVVQRLLLVFHWWFFQQTRHQYPHLCFCPRDAFFKAHDRNLEVVGLAVVVCCCQVVGTE